MNGSESIPLIGIFKISKVYPSGKNEVIYDEENVITLARKQFILSGIYLPAIVSDQVNRFRVGTGGTIDPEGLFPKTEDSSRTDLYTPLLTVSVTYVLNTSVPSVTFLADLDQSQGNGSLINEAGLITAGGSLFNIKTFPAIPKSTEFSLHTEWTIKIA